MLILGLDPGLRRTGWGVIRTDGWRVSHVANGVCASKGSDVPSRLASLYRMLSRVVEAHEPDVAAVESVFVNRDGSGTLKLGQARGVVLLAPALAGVKVFEYAPNSVKKSVVGVGHAEKRQVEEMVRLQLPRAEIAGSDSADALAVALTHAFVGRYSEVLEDAISKSAA